MPRPTLLRTLLAVTLGLAVLAVQPAATAQDDLPVSYQFIPGALTGGQPGAVAPGTNDWSCRPSAAHPRPVVLVHGTGGNRATNWQTYGPLLKNHGYCVFALTYGAHTEDPYPISAVGGMKDMRFSARQLRRFVGRVLAATGAAKVDLVGHSQGTLMPNYYLKFLGGATKVERYISLAPLWHGILVGDVMDVVIAAFGLGDYDVPFCAACGQFRTGSSFMKRMRAGGVAVPGVRYVNIVTRYDEVVFPYTSGIQKGMRNIVVQNVCPTDFSDHLEIAASRNVAQIVLNQLDPRHRTPVRCSLVLPVFGP